VLVAVVVAEVASEGLALVSLTRTLNLSLGAVFGEAFRLIKLNKLPSVFGVVGALGDPKFRGLVAGLEAAAGGVVGGGLAFELPLDSEGEDTAGEGGVGEGGAGGGEEGIPKVEPERERGENKVELERGRRGGSMAGSGSGLPKTKVRTKEKGARTIPETCRANDGGGASPRNPCFCSSVSMLSKAAL